MSKPETLYQLQRLAPTWWLEDLWLIGEHDNHTPIEAMELTSFETPGDLGILFSILRKAIRDNDDRELITVAELFKFTMAGPLMLSCEEFEEIPVIKDAKLSYGALIRTFQIWSWG